MPVPPPDPIIAPVSPGLSLGDIYYILFRHKWKIVACTLAGIAAAIAVWKFNAPPYKSEAELYVRYVLSEKGIGPANSDTSAKSPDQRGETIMNSEAAILSSADSMRAVAQTIGPDKILAKVGGGNDVGLATAVIKQGLAVEIPKASSVINVTFSHPDPDIVQPVLRQIIAQYLKLHVETHTASGAMGDFLTQETDQLRSRLNQTEDELRKATAKAGVISVEDAKKSYADQIASIRRDLYAAEAELAERSTAYEEVTKRLANDAKPAPAPTASDAPVPSEILDAYRSASTQYMLLQRMEEELLTQFTPQNPRVQEVHAQAAKADETRRKLLERYPRLAQIGAVAERGTADPANEVTTSATQINALKARVAVLRGQLTGLGTEVSRLEQMEGTITELRRKKDLEESNYRYFAASLEQARINETLGNGRVSNIIQIQTPSPAFVQPIDIAKKLGLIVGAGLALGLGWAFAIDLYLDRSIKRPIDVERTLASPLLISIPRLRHKHMPRLASAEKNETSDSISHADGNFDAALLPYHETLRDRLIAYFESIGLNHKPKLVAVTSLNKNAGVTTTAAGLARSLSETGDGNVLLVDMTAGDGVAQRYAKGHPVHGLDDVLQQPNGAHVQPKLYVVTEAPPQDRLWHSMPRRFTALVPKMKASDFDYIIFDMPPVNQISITPRLAGFMDLVLLVIEAERTDRDVVRRATKLFGQSRASVGVVLNQTRRYVPNRLHQELALSA